MTNQELECFTDPDMYHKVEILDCTIRDGGYLNLWDYSDEEVRECYRAASEAGFDYFEIGFRSSKADFDQEKYGRWIYSEEEDIKRVTEGIDGCKIAVMSKIDNKNINIHHFVPKEESAVTMVRVLLPYLGCIPLDLLQKAKVLCEQLLQLGYEVTLNLACIDKITASELEIVCREIHQLDLKYLYFADTYGATSEKMIKEKTQLCLKLFREKYPSQIQVGFHAHNNLHDAYPRSVKALEYGARIVDGCMFGMGRGAGNLPSELLVGHLYRETAKPFFQNRYNILPVLQFINRYLIHYQDKIHGRLRWGYNILYVLTGFTGCHPSYATELIEMEEEFSVEEIFGLITEILQNGQYVNYNRGYIKEYLTRRTYRPKLPTPQIEMEEDSSEEEKETTNSLNN